MEKHTWCPFLYVLTIKHLFWWLKLLILKCFHYFELSSHFVFLSLSSSLFAYFYHMYCFFLWMQRRPLLIPSSVKMWFLWYSVFNYSVFSNCLISCPPLPPLVSVSPPDADPQLCGVPVLLPTWAERLFPPGPPPGTNEQPQQQVGGRTAAWNNDHESPPTLCTACFQKYDLHFWLTALAWTPYCKSGIQTYLSKPLLGGQGSVQGRAII